MPYARQEPPPRPSAGLMTAIVWMQDIHTKSVHADVECCNNTTLKACPNPDGGGQT